MEDSKRLLAELTQLIKAEQRDEAYDDERAPPPPPSVKASENQLVKYDDQKWGTEHNKPWPDSRKSIAYPEECVTVLPDIELMPRDIDVDQYLKEREKGQYSDTQPAC